MYKSAKISHAIAYCEVYMNVHDYGEYPQFDCLNKGLNVLTTSEIVNIIKETVKTSEMVGRALVLEEMSLPEFRDYVRKRFRVRDGTLRVSDREISTAV